MKLLNDAELADGLLINAKSDLIKHARKSKREELSESDKERFVFIRFLDVIVCSAETKKMCFFISVQINDRKQKVSRKMISQLS